jgi:hypothetical protein
MRPLDCPSYPAVLDPDWDDLGWSWEFDLREGALRTGTIHSLALGDAGLPEKAGLAQAYLAEVRAIRKIAAETRAAQEQAREADERIRQIFEAEREARKAEQAAQERREREAREARERALRDETPSARERSLILAQRWACAKCGGRARMEIAPANAYRLTCALSCGPGAVIPHAVLLAFVRKHGGKAA